MKLRYYQEDCIKEILKMNKGERKIVEAYTLHLKNMIKIIKLIVDKKIK